MWRHAINLAEQTNDREKSAMYQTADAMSEARAGNSEAAGRSAKAALDLSRGLDVMYGSACALALSGELVETQKLVDEIVKRFPEDTNAQYYELPVLRALIALDRGNSAKALEALEAARPFDLAMAGPDFTYRFGGLYPVYVRGEAYLAARRGAEDRGGIPAGLRASGSCFRRPHLRAGTLAIGSMPCFVGEFRKGKDCLPGVP